MKEVKLRRRNGVPAIYVNGEFQEAQMLYLSTPAPGDEEGRAIFLRQAALAAETGVHIFTFHCTMDTDLMAPPEETNGYLRDVMRELTAVDPQALLLPRCSFDTRLEALHTPAAEAVRFTDGRGMEAERSSFAEYAANPACLAREGEKRPFADFVSDYWRAQAMQVFSRFIRACRGDAALEDHMLGYHFAAGMSSECYQCRYWDGVLDISEANQRGFRTWLRRKYGTDSALTRSWGRPATLMDARVPEDLPGIRREFTPEIRALAQRDRRVFDLTEWYTWRSWDAELDQPDARNYSFRVWLDMQYHTDQELSEAWGGAYSLSDRLVPEDFADWFVPTDWEPLLHGPGRARFSDYMDYYADQVAALIETAAATVKRETEGCGLACFFYAYHYDVQSAQSGHHSTARVLRCPDVDILCSPLSYYDRNEGGMGAYMANVSSIHAAGKLWLDESDYRQPVVIRQPRGMDVCMSIGSLQGAREIILRQCGKLALYQAANWWMDLRGLGWYDSPELWAYIAQGRQYQAQMEAVRRETQAEVVLLDDEKAMSFVGDAWIFGDDLMNKTRNELYHSGLSFDLRMLEDFLDGSADGAKLYVFLNPFRLIASGKAEAVRRKLEALGAAALWLYGFSPDDDPAAVRALTGFDVEVREDAAASLTVDGEVFARRCGRGRCVPRGGEALGFYPDGLPAFAVTQWDGHDAWFLGGTRVHAKLLRLAAARAGARLFGDMGDVFLTRGNLAVLHTVSGGPKRLSFPAKRVTELRSGAVTPGDFTLETQAYTTYLFILDSEAEQ